MGTNSAHRQAAYPWIICASCTLLIFFSIGMCGNTMPVHYPFLAQEKGFNNAQLSAITTIRCVGAFVSMGLLPRLTRRFPLRSLTLATCLLIAASYLLMSGADRLLTLYTAAAGTGLAYGLGSMVLVSVLVRNWFDRREGLALSICASGSGLASMAASPLITVAIERSGLASAFRLEAAAAVLAGLLMFSLVRDDPAHMGLRPYGGGKRTRQSAPEAQQPVKQVRMSRRHQKLIIAAMLATGPLNIASFSFYTLQYAGCGYSPMTIAAGLSMFGLLLTVSKLIYGWCNDRFGVYICNWLFLSVSLLGNLLVALAPLFPPGVMIFVSLALTALGYPPMMIGISLWARDLCPPEDYTKKVALYQQLSMVGGMAGTLLGGFSADLTGNYTLAYIGCAALLLFTLLSVQYLYRYYGRSRKIRPEKTGPEKE